MRMKMVGHRCCLQAISIVFIWSQVPSPYVYAGNGGAGDVVVYADRIHVGDGQTVVNGAVVIRDGVIVAVGTDITVPDDATVVRITDGYVTPGLIDANAAIEATDVMTAPMGRRTPRAVLHDFFCPRHVDKIAEGCCGSRCSRSLQHVTGHVCGECGFPNDAPSLAVGTRTWSTDVENSSEIIPHTRVLDAINLRSPDFGRLAKGGVTTVFAAPDSSAVIGSRGAILRTGGPMRERVVRAADAVKATMGTEPSWRGGRNRSPWRNHVSLLTRRPSTRMGVAWIFRKAFYDSRLHDQGKPFGGADAPPSASLLALHGILAGDIPLRIQARQQHDILTACRLTKEFGLSFILEEGTESYKCLEELKSQHVPVIFGPLYVDAPGARAYSTEVAGARLHTFQRLLADGVTTALTANELRDEDGLARQAMYARRMGVSFNDVLRSVTQTPAQLLRIGEEVGTLEVGKRGDLIVWDGRPFDADARPIVVMSGGIIIVDRRPS